MSDALTTRHVAEDIRTRRYSADMAEDVRFRRYHQIWQKISMISPSNLDGSPRRYCAYKCPIWPKLTICDFI
jgi:hypothetical protein